MSLEKTLQQHKFSFTCMGCPGSLFLYTKTPPEAQRLFETVFKVLNHLDATYTDYTNTSLTAAINQSAGDRNGIKVDTQTATLLDYAQECHRISDGLFDITAGVLKSAWDFRTAKPQLPKDSLLKKLLARIGWDKVIWKKPKLVLPLKGMTLDFGGVVKEYAADFAANLCRAQGVHHGLVDLGGDLAIIGPHPDGRAWGIGVQHPRKPEEDIALIPLKGGGLASSGDYARCFEIDGKRYSHILNPKTGWPVEGLSTVSVVAHHCLIAGSTSTIAMLKGEKEGLAWLQSSGLPYFCADHLGNSLATKKLNTFKIN